MNELWLDRPDHIPVLGHRGICAKYPENTLVSFEAAIDLGVDLIEFDVNVTKDHELVVIHNTSIDSVSDHTGLVRDYTLAELKSFDFGGKFSEKFRGTAIPTLREVLALAKEKSDTLLLNVEIKDMTQECVDHTVAMLEEFGLCERSVLACFDAAIIRYAKKKFPFMRTQGFPGRYMQNFTEETYDCMFGIGIPGWWSGWGADEETVMADVRMARERGILPWLFCADTEEAVRNCVRAGAANITGNDPEVALRVLRTMKKHR